MNMGAQARARRAFAVTLAAAAAGVAAWYAWPSHRATVYEVRTREAVSGLIAGAPVEFHGVEVGQVRAVNLLDARTVQVLLELRKGTPVSSATLATVTSRGLATRGFTGYVYVSLEDRGEAGAPLPRAEGDAWPRIASAPGQAVSLDTSISDLNRSVQVATGLLSDVLDRDTIASLKQSAAALDQLTRTLAANNRRIETILANAERASVRVQPLLRSTGQALDTLQARVLPHSEQTLARFDALSGFATEHLGPIFLNTERASTRLEPLLQSGSEAMRSVQTQLLPQAQRSLVRIEHLSSSLDDTVDRMKRNPAVLLRGSNPVPAGPGEAR